jgi:hypothetical protein
MKSFFTLLIALLSVAVGFAQRIVDSTFYENGVIKSYGHYDSTYKHWNFYQFYRDGKLSSRQKLDPVYLQNCDSFVAYYPGGQIAWILPHNGRFATGKLEEFYPSGQLKRSGYYYRYFKTGAWKEYYPDGQLKTESYFSLSKSDSSFYRRLTPIDYKTGFATSDTLSWGGTDTVLTQKTDVFYPPMYYSFTVLIPKKTGVWITYDQEGRVIRRTRYSKQK